MIVGKRIVSLLACDGTQQILTDRLTGNIYTACSFRGCYGKRENIFCYAGAVPEVQVVLQWKQSMKGSTERHNVLLIKAQIRNESIH